MEITRLEGCQKVVTQGNDRQSGICSTYPCCGIAWDILGNQCCIVQSYVQRLFQVAAHVFQNWVVTFSECLSSLLFLKIISMLADLWHKWWCGLHWRRSPDQGRLQVIPKWPLIWYDINPSRKASCCLEVVVVGFFCGFLFSLILTLQSLLPKGRNNIPWVKRLFNQACFLRKSMLHYYHYHYHYHYYWSWLLVHADCAGSFSGLGYLTMYLAGKVGFFDRRGHLWKFFPIVAPLLTATFVGISRIDNYWHRWSDVLAGALLGKTIVFKNWSDVLAGALLGQTIVFKNEDHADHLITCLQ